ncbi:FliA/WhiG family RNA polymerase sigma factor [Alkalicoccus urumqiensis]|uniref:FliA/WhiG family RNA polymerase sigma factor n=1 Tax=Alkalicoccus urumqiensis TaxID=1548213 RepID=A0A2P6MFZ6_ALKUR|nr:FliA/WhiG family RNA polymerase sigma factor [Alkalicoccus urumqiensis]PRO65206.1 FliA/WhiG family RNA polymerase sigma factor [Alkalicoccus urumqiensis]
MSRKAETEMLHHYWDQWLSDQDTSAADELIRAYLPLVEYHVQRVRAALPKNVRTEELHSHGMTGLYDALQKFDAERDLKFDTYASFRIRGAIMDGLRREDWLPRGVREKTKKLERASEKLEQKLGREPSAAEIAEELSLTETEVFETMKDSFHSHMLSVDEKTGEEGGEETYVQTLADEKAERPDARLDLLADKELLGAAVQKLNDKEQTVIALFYTEEMTLTEIGEIMNLTTSRISQIHSKSLFKLKQYLTESD